VQNQLAGEEILELCCTDLGQNRVIGVVCLRQLLTDWDEKSGGDSSGR
jgi:hypothetical protein